MANGMPRLDGEALGAAHGRPGGGATGRERQLVASNRAPDIGKMDNKGVEEGLRLYEGGRRNGVSNRPIH